MAFLNSILGKLFDVLLLPFRSLNPWAGMAFISFLTGLLMLFIYRLASNQAGIRVVKARIKAHLLELRLYKDNMSVTMRAQGRILGANLRYLALNLKPLLVMVSIAPLRYSHDLIKESGVFAVNVLRPDQVDLGKRFGYKSGRQVDKFAGLDWLAAATGAPILPQAYAYLDCRLADTFTAGDHTLFIGEVVEAKILHPQAAPLVFKKGDFF